jgi:hypothetical protein
VKASVSDGGIYSFTANDFDSVNVFVPEPASVLLLAISIFGLIAVKRIAL